MEVAIVNNITILLRNSSKGKAVRGNDEEVKNFAAIVDGFYKSLEKASDCSGPVAGRVKKRKAHLIHCVCRDS